MSLRPLDTPAIARRPERDCGFDARRAEGGAETPHERIGGGATKEDLTAAAGLATKAALARLETKTARWTAAQTIAIGRLRSSSSRDAAAIR